jgi:hypothetical protein
MQGEEETHLQGIYTQVRTMLMYSKSQSEPWKKCHADRTGPGEGDDSDIGATVLEHDVYCENRDTFIGNHSNRDSCKRCFL